MRHAPSLLLAAALSTGAAAAHAQSDQTKTLFNAGAQAYEAGQFPAAIQAFEQAYRLSARPGILFSIAQAHRKQYYVARSVQELREAIAGYREYVAKVPQGGRRSDAAEALIELEPLAAKLDPSGGTSSASSVAPVTRVMVSAQTAGAVVSLDGGKPVDAPLFTEVKPGKHALRVTAAGYFDEARDIEVAPGSVLALDVSLKDKPGHLAIRAGAGAQVSIDGRFVATTPLSQPIDVEPGRHVVSITRNGYHAYGREIAVERDQATSLVATLEGTRQRTASYVLLGTGLATAVAGGVLAGFALHEQGVAAAFDAKRRAGGATCAPTPPGTDCAAYVTSEYSSHVTARDELKRDAGVTLGAAVLVAGTGIVLFAFDQPNASAMTMRRDDAPRPAPIKDRPMEMSAVPLVAPGFYGASLSGRF